MPELDPTLVDRAVAEAKKRAANLDYLFDSLTSPDWIVPLRERGLFSEPPEQRTEGGYVLAPPWAASRYLARMAEAAPELVTQTIESLDSNNERVREDFIEAALAMPREFTQRLAKNEATWVASREQIYYSLPRKIVALITRLIENGDTELAFELIKGLFAPSEVVRDEGLGQKRPQPRFSDWEYDHLLQEVADELVAVAPRGLLQYLVRLLGAALDLLRSEEHDDAHFDLISRIWRVRIADDRDRATRFEGALVSAVRDTSRRVRADRLLTDQDIFAELTSRPEELFRRLMMDALAHGPEPDIGIVRSLVVDPAQLTSEPSVEFRDLLSTNADRLPREDVESLLSAIRSGPNVERYRKRIVSELEREPTENEVAQYVAFWRVGRLELLLGALNNEEQAEYAALRKLAPDAQLPVSFEVHTSFVGPQSPLTIEEMEQKSDADLLDFLATWEPDDRWDRPSLEGLARALSKFAQRNAERVARLAPELRHLRPALVQWAFEGLDSALHEGDGFYWPPVIELARWVVEQPREIPGGRGDTYDDLDPGWVWTRRQIVSLIERGLRLEDERGIPFGEREDVWAVIEAVATDPDPTPETEERYGGSNMDPFTLALNTTRPRALSAAVAYGAWVRRSIDADRVFALSTEVPELAALIDEHLDSSADPSTAVRAILGHGYSNLLSVDGEWAPERAPQIFPDDDSPLREAGWGAFVIYTWAHPHVFSTLRAIYDRSAELAGSAGHGFRWDVEPYAKLGEHLATFYWHGTIELDDPILQTFWANASPDVRRHTIEFVGRSATELDGASEDVVVQRLIKLWELILSEGHAWNSTGNDLTSFGWWFSASALPADWRLTALLDLLRDNVKPEPAFLVVEELPRLVESAPAKAAEALRRVLELEEQGWSVDSWSEQIEQVLRSSLGSSDPEARRLAEDTAHWLGSLGYRQFRHVLEEARPTSGAVRGPEGDKPS